MLREMKAAFGDRYGNLPGVTGFGIAAGTLRVYVRDADVATTLPSVFRGLPVVVVVVGELRADVARKPETEP